MDFAGVLRRLVEEMYAEAEKVVLVMDNLNTHKLASCTRRSSRPRPGGSPSGWRSTTRRSTGSWLNMAEIELSVLARQCLDRRIPDRGWLGGRWRRGRRSGTRGVEVEWQFTTADARIKLRRLYPALKPATRWATASPERRPTERAAVWSSSPAATAGGSRPG